MRLTGIGAYLLMTHAKTKGSNRVPLHRNFAKLLDEALRREPMSSFFSKLTLCLFEPQCKFR